MFSVKHLPYLSLVWATNCGNGLILLLLSTKLRYGGHFGIKVSLRI